MIEEGRLAQLLEAYLAANLATNMLWAIYCVWCRKHYGKGAGAIDHRGKARYNPLYILYKDAEAKRLCISRAITRELGFRGWMRVLLAGSSYDMHCTMLTEAGV